MKIIKDAFGANYFRTRKLGIKIRIAHFNL